MIKNLKQAKIWVAYPTDYTRFMQSHEEMHEFALQDGEYWHTLLTGEIGARTGVMPVIPRYRYQSFVLKSIEF